VSLMCLKKNGSGAKYQGRNESLWEHQGVDHMGLWRQNNKVQKALNPQPVRIRIRVTD